LKHASSLIIFLSGVLRQHDLGTFCSLLEGNVLFAAAQSFTELNPQQTSCK